MNNAIAGISGGRTSARMAYMLDSSVVLAFQNTGLEHAKTYEFLDRIEDDIGRPIVRLEFRAPERGEPPKARSFEIVDSKHLSRHGEPFRDLLECLKAYRAKHKGKGPVAPYANMRLCTAYLKVRTQRSYCEALGWGGPTEYTEYVGLRADEPGRVAKMKQRNQDRDTDECAPLFDAGIAKDDVLSFWRSKSFDLEIGEHLGNCNCCFLKDERDLATALIDPTVDANFWIDIENDFGPMRRGGRPSYRQVYEEAPMRMVMRDAILSDRIDDARELGAQLGLTPKRVKLIIAQEKAAHVPFACECDAAKAEDFDGCI